MASPRIIPQLLERNAHYAKTHTPMPFIPEFPPEAQKPRVIVLACCDARVNPEAALGLKPGEAIVIRNAGCDVPRNMANILLLSHVRPDIEELLIIQHNDCGVTYTTDEAIREGIKTVAPDHVEQIDNLSFGTFQNNLASVEERARKSVNFIKASPFIKRELAENTVGAVYDIKTGLWCFNFLQVFILILAVMAPIRVALAPITIELHDSSSDSAERIEWDWKDWHKELPVRFRIVAEIYESFTWWWGNEDRDWPRLHDGVKRLKEFEELFAQYDNQG
ncbi:hypothetical protein SUNI508_11424 [Seiridium unicorne]|uniref:Carbonic anhydrase n=1 Tax=Seiridium unicorne TaxID=138068 RepID=A0ABR2UH76_9PEZI